MGMVNFKVLLMLANEIPNEDNPFALIIENLAMCDIPMSDAVIELGIACGVLLPGYKNGWSEEN